jgi:hypothetical protein
LRYRGGTLAEFWRALRTLKALQAEAVASPRVSALEIPIEPEARTNPGEITSAPSPLPARRADAAGLAGDV